MYCLIAALHLAVTSIINIESVNVEIQQCVLFRLLLVYKIFHTVHPHLS